MKVTTKRMVCSKMKPTRIPGSSLAIGMGKLAERLDGKRFGNQKLSL
jgi:hypothetical protein